MTEEQLGFTIEKGVPIPKPLIDSFKEALGQMEVGDSIFVANINNTFDSRRHAGLLDLCNKALSGRYTTRQIDGGVRFWRTG